MLKLREPSVAKLGSNVIDKVLFELGLDTEGLIVYLTCFHFPVLDLTFTDVVVKTSEVKLDPREIVKVPLYAPLM